MVEADNVGAMLLGLEEIFRLLSYYIRILLRDFEGPCNYRTVLTYT